MSDEENEREIGGKMSFLEHLDELRRRLISCLIYVTLGFVVCWFFHAEIFRFVSQPIQSYLGPGKLVFTKPTEAFSLYLKVSLIAGIFVSSPLIIYQVWLFIAPGLYRREKRMAAPFVISSLFLFLGGAAFAFLIVLPPAYKFLLDFGSDFQPMIKADEYWDLTSTIILGFGLIFEMPVLIAFLSMFGIVTPGFLWRNFKYAVLIIFIIAAVASPTPDAITQCIYAAPMILLYLLSILVSLFFKRRRDIRERAESE
jgi:sec-independent protein translocase protein TatC